AAGGPGRAPLMAHVLRDWLPKQHLLSYLEAALRVYNEYGRRDNIYKARIKILVQSLGIEKMREAVEAKWARMDHSQLDLSPEIIASINAHFAPPSYEQPGADDETVLSG